MKKSSKPKCSTIGCSALATHVLTWRAPAADTGYSENVCSPCGAGYASRPALRATLAPMDAAR